MSEKHESLVKELGKSYAFNSFKRDYDFVIKRNIRAPFFKDGNEESVWESLVSKAKYFSELYGKELFLDDPPERTYPRYILKSVESIILYIEDTEGQEEEKIFAKEGDELEISVPHMGENVILKLGVVKLDSFDLKVLSRNGYPLEEDFCTLIEWLQSINL